jgi:hypothetical protein
VAVKRSSGGGSKSSAARKPGPPRFRHWIFKGTISEEDKELFLFTDSIEEAVDYIKFSTEKFNLKTEKPHRPFGWLLERRFRK